MARAPVSSRTRKTEPKAAKEAKVSKPTKAPKSKITKSKVPKTNSKDGLTEKAILKLVSPIVTQLDAVIADKGEWCDGGRFAPARGLLQSWIDDTTGKPSSPPQKLDKVGAQKTFIDPIIGQLAFVLANKDWCDGARFSQASKTLADWVAETTEAQLCTQGAKNALEPIIAQLDVVLAKKGSWCDGKRFGPARTLLQDYVDAFYEKQAEEADGICVTGAGCGKTGVCVIGGVCG